MRTALTARALWTGETLLHDPILLIEDGIVASVATRGASEAPRDVPAIDYPGATLAPAFVDVHTHGAAAHDVMEATPEALAAIGSFLATHGVGSYLPTTVTAPVDKTLCALSGLAGLIRKADPNRTRPVGIHLEGPFLSHQKRGVHPPEYLLAPDTALFDRFFEASDGLIRLITLAPELPGAAEFAAHVTARGVRVSLGHSNATAEETRTAIAAGSVSATHTFNAMRPLDHREPGILGAVLNDDALFAELICDGVHTAPEMVKLWWRAKGPERAILVTDAMSAAGMPDGDYFLGGFAVRVENRRAMANGVLAGSVLTLDKALANFVKFTGEPVSRALPLLTSNPAKMAGLIDSAGRIAPGMPADLVAVDENAGLVASILNGQRVTG